MSGCPRPRTAVFGCLCRIRAEVCPARGLGGTLELPPASRRTPSARRWMASRCVAPNDKVNCGTWLDKDLRTLLEEPNEHAGSGGVSRGVRERPAQEELAGSDLTGTLRADRLGVHGAWHERVHRPADVVVVTIDKCAEGGLPSRLHGPGTTATATTSTIFDAASRGLSDSGNIGWDE